MLVEAAANASLCDLLISGYLGVLAIPVNFACSLCTSLIGRFPSHFIFPFTQFSLPDHHLFLKRPTTDRRLLKASLLQLPCDENFHSFAHHGIPFFSHIP